MKKGNDLPPPADVKIRYQVHQKLHDIKAYIDDQRGNNLEDTTGSKVLSEIFEGLFFIRRYPFSSRQVRDLPKNYRQRRVATSYMFYYYATDDGKKVYVIDLRHTSQRPLKPSTLKRYKNDIED